MRHLVLFDIDGTILRTGGAGREAMEAALDATFGTHGSPSYRYDGKTDRQIVRELMRGEGFSDADIDSRMEDVMRRYVEGLRARLAEPGREISMYPGVAELIEEIDARHDTVLGLLTGNVAPGATLKLAAVGLDIRRFEVGAFGSDHEVRGELPRIAHQRMLETFGITLEGRDVIVIGDTPADIACGRSIGARAIAVATGRYSLEELREHEPHAAFADLSDLKAVLDAIAA